MYDTTSIFVLAQYSVQLIPRLPTASASLQTYLPSLSRQPLLLLLLLLPMLLLLLPAPCTQVCAAPSGLPDTQHNSTCRQHQTATHGSRTHRL
jgi:hypothetical protein